MTDIIITGLEAATNTNLLANSRLETLPAGTAWLYFACSANLADASNQFALTIELPSGLIPIDGQLVPANGDGATGVLDDRTKLEWTWPAVVGGRYIFSIVETGTALFTWLVQAR